jgi:hypothetical protein
MGGVERVISDVARRYSQDGDSCGLGYLALNAVEMGIHRSGFPPGIGEYRVVDAWEDSLGGQAE